MVKVVAAGRAVTPMVAEKNMRKPLYMNKNMIANILSQLPI